MAGPSAVEWVSLRVYRAADACVENTVRRQSPLSRNHLVSHSRNGGAIQMAASASACRMPVIRQPFTS
eukprot:1744244-Prymnesium_polylepis.1